METLMSTNFDTLRRRLGGVATAALILTAGAGEAVAAQHSRSEARPPSSSSSSSSISRSGGSSGSSSSHSSGGASPTRPGGGGGSPTVIPNDTRNGRYHGGGGYYGGYGGHYGHGGYWGGYPYWGWYGYWGAPWYWGYYGGYPYYGGVTVYPNGAYGDLGALDLDLAPEKAEVYVDGQRVGVADDFDGFPAYLWLKEGTYDVAFYLPGFKTLARQYTIYPGLVVDVNDTLEQGEAVLPQDLGPKTHERRDARIREDREREEYWRDRSPESMPAPENGHDVEQGDRRDVRQEPATLHLGVEPSDASVYLDGRFIGTAEELSGLRSGLIVDAGSHRLEIVRPGYRSDTRTFEAVSGREVGLTVALEEGD